MALADDLERIATAASAFADGQSLVAVIATEPSPARRAYLCAFANDEEARSWLVLDDGGAPVTARPDVHEAVTIAALCEIAEESAFPGDLAELRAQLGALRVSERPEDIEDAEAAALALQRLLGAPPHLATPKRLDEIGQAARRLELALDPAAGSPFAAAMRTAHGAVEQLAREVASVYLVGLE